eukprot:358433-Chlamydomonas_euryale.AAC.3
MGDWEQAWSRNQPDSAARSPRHKKPMVGTDGGDIAKHTAGCGHCQVWTLPGVHSQVWTLLGDKETERETSTHRGFE